MGFGRRKDKASRPWRLSAKLLIVSSVVTVIGFNFGQSLTGAILVETVYAWPGLGNLFITSITNRDYPVLQGIFLLTSVAVVVVNIGTDLLYAALDPRVRLA